MPITIDKPAAQVAPVPNSTGGGFNQSNQSDTETGVGTNCCFSVGGALYVMVIIGAQASFPPYSSYPGPSSFQWYKSIDSGLTWLTTGPTFLPTGSGKGLAQVVDADGRRIWACYAQFPVPGGLLKPIFLTPFDTVTQTWGTELVFDPNTGIFIHEVSPAGPIAAYRRPDNSFVFIFADTDNDVTFAVTFDGVSFGARVDVVQPVGGQNYVFESSIMRPDGTVDVFYTRVTDHTYFHTTFRPNNTVGSPVLMFTGPDIIDWTNPGGLGWGVLDNGTYYLACGIQTADPGTVGKPGVIFGDDVDGWTLGNVLDTSAPVGYSVYNSPAIFLVNGTLVYYVRMINAAGTQYIERVGSAPLGSFNTPADWVFQTVYDFSAPFPLVGAQPTPYTPANFETTFAGQGNGSGLIQTGNVIRFVTTMINGNGALFPAFLFSITGPPSPPAAGRRPVAPGAGGGGPRPTKCGCPPEVLQAEKIRRQRAREAAWPYEHIFPPSDADDVQVFGAFPVGALASEVSISYLVPSGFRFFLFAVLADYTGGTFTPGDAIFIGDLNFVPGGSPSVQSSLIQGLQDVEVPLGSVAEGNYWPFAKPYEFGPLDLVRLRAVNVNFVSGFFSLALLGWIVPFVR